MIDEEKVDFITKRNKSKILPLTKAKREDWQNKADDNTSIEMRIVKIETASNNVVTMQLIFRIDYFPKDLTDSYFIFINKDVQFYDAARLFEKEPLGELSLWYLSEHYQESAQGLCRHLKKQCKKVLNRDIEILRAVTDDEATQGALYAMNAYLERTQNKG